MFHSALSCHVLVIWLCICGSCFVGATCSPQLTGYSFSLVKCCNEQSCSRNGELRGIWVQRGILCLQCCNFHRGKKWAQTAASSPACLDVTEKEGYWEKGEPQTPSKTLPSHPQAPVSSCLSLPLLKITFPAILLRGGLCSCIFITTLNSVTVPDFQTSNAAVGSGSGCAPWVDLCLLREGKWWPFLWEVKNK